MLLSLRGRGIVVQHRLVVSITNTNWTVLRRGDDRGVLQPDGAASRPELRLCRGRHSRGVDVGGSARPHRREGIGKFLARPDGGRSSTCLLRSPCSAPWVLA